MCALNPDRSRSVPRVRALGPSRRFSAISPTGRGHVGRRPALIRRTLTITLGILMVIWGVFLVDAQFGLELRRFGNRPLRTDGLAGILMMPLLHGDFQHLWGNTVSFFSLNALLLYFYRNLGFKVLGWSWLATGVLLWLSGAAGTSD